MDRVILIANIISGIGTLGMLISTFLKNKDSMLKLSILDFACNMIANLMLLGYSAVVINSLGGVREVLTLKGKINNKLLVMFVGITTILSIAVNNNGIVGLIACLAEIEYNIGASKVKTGTGYQIVLSINLLMWVVYCACMHLYSTGILYCIIIISSIVNIIRHKCDVEAN